MNKNLFGYFHFLTLSFVVVAVIRAVAITRRDCILFSATRSISHTRTTLASKEQRASNPYQSIYPVFWSLLPTHTHAGTHQHGLQDTVQAWWYPGKLLSGQSVPLVYHCSHEQWPNSYYRRAATGHWDDPTDCQPSRLCRAKYQDWCQAVSGVSQHEGWRPERIANLLA